MSTLVVIVILATSTTVLLGLLVGLIAAIATRANGGSTVDCLFKAATAFAGTIVLVLAALGTIGGF